MSTLTQYLTEEDLLRMPDDGYRYELVEGELRRMAPTGFEHGRCTHNLSGMLWSYVRDNDLGIVVAAETGFIIARRPDGRVTVRAADIAFVAKGRIPANADTSKYLELAPDLVVETLSPSDTALEVEEKVALWLAAGVRVVVTMNPALRSVTVHRSSHDIVKLTDQDELDLSDIIPGFRCRVSAIFD
ncbi:MAG: Uma2 family endonuclease [Blastocatellia bacterium]